MGLFLMVVRCLFSQMMGLAAGFLQLWQHCPSCGGERWDFVIGGGSAMFVQREGTFLMVVVVAAVFQRCLGCRGVGNVGGASVFQRCPNRVEG